MNFRPKTALSHYFKLRSGCSCQWCLKELTEALLNSLNVKQSELIRAALSWGFDKTTSVHPSQSKLLSDSVSMWQHQTGTLRWNPSLGQVHSFFYQHTWTAQLWLHAFASWKTQKHLAFRLQNSAEALNELYFIIVFNFSCGHATQLYSFDRKRSPLYYPMLSSAAWNASHSFSNWWQLITDKYKNKSRKSIKRIELLCKANVRAGREGRAFILSLEKSLGAGFYYVPMGLWDTELLETLGCYSNGPKLWSILDPALDVFQRVPLSRPL